MNGAAGSDFTSQLTKGTELYSEVDSGLLKLQLSNLSTHFREGNIIPTLTDCLTYLRSLSPAAKKFYSEVCTVVRLILVMPASNAISERTFSVMRRVKTYLRSTMNQSRLNHVMILNIYKGQLDNLDLTAIANDFVSGSEHRLRVFGKF